MTPTSFLKDVVTALIPVFELTDPDQEVLLHKLDHALAEFDQYDLTNVPSVLIDTTSITIRQAGSEINVLVRDSVNRRQRTADAYEMAEITIDLLKRYLREAHVDSYDVHRVYSLGLENHDATGVELYYGGLPEGIYITADSPRYRELFFAY